MSDLENTTEDSGGATEVEAVAQSEGTTDQSASSQGTGSDLPDEVYYDFDGEEVSASQLREWKSGHMKNADYTQKTQKHSAEVKAFNAQRDEFGQKLEMLSTLEADIEALALGDLRNVDLDKILAEEGTDEYLRVQRELDKRKQSLSGLTKKFADLQGNVIKEAHAKLVKDLGWSDPAKHKADVEAIQGYVKDAGIPEKEFAKIASPEIMKSILEAAKYRKLMTEKATVTKKVTQAPKATQPKNSSSPKTLSLAERMYGKNS